MPRVCDEGCHLFEPLCKGVEYIDDAVVVDDLVCIDRIVAPACTQDAVDQLRLSGASTLGERMEEIFSGGLKCGSWV